MSAEDALLDRLHHRLRKDRSLRVNLEQLYCPREAVRNDVALGKVERVIVDVRSEHVQPQRWGGRGRRGGVDGSDGEKWVDCRCSGATVNRGCQRAGRASRKRITDMSRPTRDADPGSSEVRGASRKTKRTYSRLRIERMSRRLLRARLGERTGSEPVASQTDERQNPPRRMGRKTRRGTKAVGRKLYAQAKISLEQRCCQGAARRTARRVRLR